MEKNKPLDTDSGDLELESAEGDKDVSEADKLEEKADTSEEGAKTLEYFKKLTGRDFKSAEDFEKHYKELSTFVGQNPKELKEKAEAFDKLIEDANKTVKEAEKEGDVTPEISQLKTKVSEMELERHYPEATKHLGILQPLAENLGITLKEAYENHLKDLVTSKIEADKTKEQEKSISVESKGRISSDKSAKISQLVEDVSKTDSEKSKQDLVREYLSE